MKRRTLGAALFFCGFGILITVFCPLEGWFWRVVAGIVLMILGIRSNGRC